MRSRPYTRGCSGPAATPDPAEAGSPRAAGDAPADPPACWRPCPEAACGRLREGQACTTLQDPGPVDPPHPADLPAPAGSLLALNGEVGLRRLVHRHMQRLRWTALMAGWQACFDCVGERVADFVVEACGGPRCYSERHALMRGQAPGLPVRLTPEGREVWLVQLWHACDDVGWPELLRRDLWRWAEPFSVLLLPATARAAALRRYPYEQVAAWFDHPVSVDHPGLLH